MDRSSTRIAILLCHGMPMRSQCCANPLQAQLRGLIGDYQGGDEKLFNDALEALDMLNSCLSEEAQKIPGQPGGIATQPVGLAPPPGSTPARPAADEPPLISFD